MNYFDYTTYISGGIIEVNSFLDLPIVPKSTCTIYIAKDTNSFYWYNHSTNSWQNMNKSGYLSTWYSDTGLPATTPVTPSPYRYKSGDYYLVGRVATGSGKNYKPDGSAFIYSPSPVASTVEETEKVLVGNRYLYDGVGWSLVGGSTSQITISDVDGLQSALDTHSTAINTINSTMVTTAPDRYRVGGRIFYVNSSAAGVYKFYDNSGNELTTQTVAGLATAYEYEITTAGNADKFYVYDNTNNLVGGKQWGKYGTAIGITSDGIGVGKTNTATALATSGWDGNSIFAYVQGLNTSKVGGCSDWFIGSKAEQDQLRASGLVNWYISSNMIWSSVEGSGSTAHAWDRTYWRTNLSKTNTVYACAFRAF